MWDGDAWRQPRTQTDVTDGSTIKRASPLSTVLGPPRYSEGTSDGSLGHVSFFFTDDKLIVLCGQLTSCGGERSLAFICMAKSHSTVSR